MNTSDSTPPGKNLVVAIQREFEFVKPQPGDDPAQIMEQLRKQQQPRIDAFRASERLTEDDLQLRVSLNDPESNATFDRELARLDAVFKPITDALEASQRITEDDLKLIIN